MIAHNRPLMTAEDRAAAVAVLESGWIAQGPAVETLEAGFVQLYSGGWACAVSSGTAALFLAIKSFAVGPGAIVAVPTYACSALLNAVIMTGAIPHPVDVLPDTFCMDPASVGTQAPDASCIVAVHTFGAAANIAALGSKGKVVVEDCCQSLGGKHSGIPLGATGQAAIFSFYATKIITGGQGGLVWSRSEAAVEKARDYRQFDGRQVYEPRFNLQMTDIQAALIHSQLQRLDAIRDRRAKVARQYASALPQGLATQHDIAAPDRMAQRFVIVAPDLNTRDRLRAHMTSAGVGCAVPVERFELLHRYLQLDPAAYPVAERLVDTTLSLPMHLCLTDADVSVISNALHVFRL